jgi:hypothetical protein
MVLIVDATGKEDARALGEEDLGLGPALGIDEVAAVDDGGGHGAVIDLGAGKGLPGRAGARLEQLGRMVAYELEGVAPLDEGQALGDQAFELDRLDLGAVLFALGAALGVLVVVEVALDPVDRAMEGLTKDQRRSARSSSRRVSPNIWAKMSKMSFKAASQAWASGSSR